MGTVDKLLERAINMIEAGEIRVILEQFDGNVNSFIMENNDHKLIVLNSCHTFEKQRKDVLHEIKHLDDLLTEKDIEACEYEAIQYSKIKLPFQNITK